MENNTTALNKINEMEELMHTKVDIIADHINNKRLDCAMIELGALNEYIRLQSRNAMMMTPNNNANWV